MRNKILLIALLLPLIILLNHFLVGTQPTLLNDRVSEVKSYAHSIHSIDIQDTNYEDLTFLSTILNNNKIIFLGEQLHSDEETFKAKARIIRYLHEKLGYNVLLYEAGLYDMWLMNDQFYNSTFKIDITEEQTPRFGLYSFWWDNDENKKLWNYFRDERNSDNPVSFGGFDIQLTGTLDSKFRYRLLKTYLNKKNIDFDKFKAASKNEGDIFNAFFYYRDLSQSYKDSLLTELDTINSLLVRTKKDYEDEVYIRFLSGLRHRYESVWKYSPGSPQSMQRRDSLMADNLIWQIDSVYKDKKIIVWTANVHTLYQNSVKDIQFNSLGEYIKEKYKDEAYMLVFSSYGRKNDAGGLSNKASNKSIEYVFHQTHMPYFFIDISSLPQRSFLKERNISVINQGLNIESNWSKATDGIFYIDTMTSVK